MPDTTPMPNATANAFIQKKYRSRQKSVRRLSHTASRNTSHHASPMLKAGNRIWNEMTNPNWMRESSRASSMMNLPSVQAGERIAREIFRRAVGADHVVFDAHAAVMAEALDLVPVDIARMRLRLQFCEQHIDEIDSRLDRHSHARFDGASKTQIRMAGRLWNRAAVFVFLETGDIVHLQADQMAQAMRIEHARHARFDRILRAHADKALILQYACEYMMRMHVQLGIIFAFLHFFHKSQLRVVDRVDQGLKLGRLRRCIRARDIGRIAMEAGAGVDQKGIRTRRRRTVEIGVMQHRAMLAERHQIQLTHLPLE